MFEPMQIITFCQKEGTLCTPEAPQYAGMQGDSGKTRVDFVLPADAQNDAYVYRVEMVTGGGALVTGELLDPVGGIVSQVLTHPFTESGGRCTVRLIVTQVDENGDEAGEYCALVGHVYFTNGPADALPAVKHGISEMLLGVAADAELTEQLAGEISGLAGEMSALATETKQAADRAAVAEQMSNNHVLQSQQNFVAAYNAQLAAEQAAGEAAESAQQAMPPLYATYEVTSFAEISEAYANGRAVYCVYYSYIGTLSILLNGRYATFDLIDASGQLLTLRINNNDAWSMTSTQMVTATKLPVFSSVVLASGNTHVLADNAFYMVSGTSLAFLSNDLSATGVSGFQCLRTADENDVQTAVIQYQEGDTGTMRIRTVTGDLTIRNDSTDAAVINILKKEA